MSIENKNDFCYDEPDLDGWEGYDVLVSYHDVDDLFPELSPQDVNEVHTALEAQQVTLDRVYSNRSSLEEAARIFYEEGVDEDTVQSVVSLLSVEPSMSV